MDMDNFLIGLFGGAAALFLTEGAKGIHHIREGNRVKKNIAAALSADIKKLEEIREKEDPEIFIDTIQNCSWFQIKQEALVYLPPDIFEKVASLFGRLELKIKEKTSGEMPPYDRVARVVDKIQKKQLSLLQTKLEGLMVDRWFSKIRKAIFKKWRAIIKKWRAIFKR